MSDDDKIGYGKPPKHSRFTKGQSGNANGRPKGAKNLKTELKEELAELIDLNEGGVRKRVSKRRAMLKSLVAKAVKADAKAATVIIKMIYRLLHEDEDEKRAEILHPEDSAILAAHDQRTRRRIESETVGSRPTTPIPEEGDEDDDDGS